MLFLPTSPASTKRLFMPGLSGDQGSGAQHVPVLLEEAIDGLRLEAGGIYIDGTVGAGGHSLAILSRSENTRLLGLDVDDTALQIASEHLALYIAAGRARLVKSNFEHLDKVGVAEGFSPVDGVLLDLGVSSMQLDTPVRGFSFRAEGPLDMRLDQTEGESAADLVNRLPEDELANLIYKFGEEPASRRIARRIVEARGHQPIETTSALEAIVYGALGGRVAGRTRNPIHPATKTFQALRIAVNRELEVLEKGLEAAVRVLKPGGRFAVISFHSLEDRIVKLFIRQEQRGCVCPPDYPVCVCGRQPTLRPLNSKPIEASQEEERRNPKSRSAKLRISEKLA